MLGFYAISWPATNTFQRVLGAPLTLCFRLIITGSSV